MLEQNEEISAHEKIFNKEFFMNNSTKTPARYVKIRNFCLAAWELQKPKCLTKTTVRDGLKDCGDVNAIGRVHEYLERLGAINFGCKKRKYSRRRSEGGNSSSNTSKSKSAPAPPTSSHKPKSDMIRSNLPKTKMKSKASGSKSKKKPMLNSTKKSASASPRKLSVLQRKVHPVQAKQGYIGTQVNCSSYGDTRAPFRLSVSVAATLLMCIHSRLKNKPVSGLLGGSYNVAKNLLSIDCAIPCDSSESVSFVSIFFR